MTYDTIEIAALHSVPPGCTDWTIADTMTGKRVTYYFPDGSRRAINFMGQDTNTPRSAAGYDMVGSAEVLEPESVPPKHDAPAPVVADIDMQRPPEPSTPALSVVSDGPPAKQPPGFDPPGHKDGEDEVHETPEPATDCNQANAVDSQPPVEFTEEYCHGLLAPLLNGKLGQVTKRELCHVLPGCNPRSHRHNYILTAAMERLGWKAATMYVHKKGEAVHQTGFRNHHCRASIEFTNENGRWIAKEEF